MHMFHFHFSVSAFYDHRVVATLSDHLGIYTASKAALAAASESWRLELRPLGVRTITLITCAVKTNFFADTTEIVLPETSKYNGIRGFINEINDGRLQATGISTSQYANKVVREVEKGTVGEVWVGKDAFMAWLGWALSPRAVLVSANTKSILFQQLIVIFRILS